MIVKHVKGQNKTLKLKTFEIPHESMLKTVTDDKCDLVIRDMCKTASAVTRIQQTP